MILKMDEQNIKLGMGLTTEVLKDQLLKDELKNIVIWIKNQKVRFVSWNGNMMCVTDVEAEVDCETNNDQEAFIQVKAKDINDILNNMRTLKYTKISGVEFHINGEKAILQIHEEARNTEMEFSEYYKLVSRYRIVRTRVKDIMKEEVKKFEQEVKGEDIESNLLISYLDSLLPSVIKATRECINKIIFSEKYIYTRNMSHATILKNFLPEVCQGYQMPATNARVLQKLAKTAEVVNIHKVVSNSGMVQLTIKTGNSVLVIKCSDLTKAFNIAPYLDIPSDGVSISKLYLIDVLKRVNLGVNSTICIEVNISGNKGVFNIESERMTQKIPVFKSKGEGNYRFSISTRALSDLIMGHIKEFGGEEDRIYMYFEEDVERRPRGITIACRDNTGAWHTIKKELSQPDEDYKWKKRK